MILRYLPVLLRHRAPGQLILQYSNHCNATCPQCTMRVSNRFQRSRLDWGQATRIVDHAAHSRFLSLSLTGGEPLLHAEEVLALLNHAAEKGIPFTRTGTNGFVFKDHRHPDYEDRVRRLAISLQQSRVYSFWISIDSALPGIHEQMRGLPGVIEGIRKALPIFHDCGIYPSVNLGLNRNTGKIGRLAEVGPERFFSNCCLALEDFYQFCVITGPAISFAVQRRPTIKPWPERQSHSNRTENHSSRECFPSKNLTHNSQISLNRCGKQLFCR